MDTLEPEERKMISDQFLARIKANVNPYVLLAEILSDWGVMCPHPPSQQVMSKTGKWSTCRGCGGAVVNGGSMERSYTFTGDVKL